MSIKLGTKEVVIVSNASVAREILQKNDQICAFRSIPTAVQAHDHDKFSMAWLPVTGAAWRLLRKVSKEQMFAAHRFDGSQDLRQEKLRELVQFIEKSSGGAEAVDIGSAERFLGSEIEAKGSHFELIPFGGGRRMCPGLPLANRMIHLMLASLVHNIEWKLESEAVDMEEKFGLSIKKACPLKAIPVKL